jgi:tetraacyldisaccharide 4'-kinase
VGNLTAGGTGKTPLVMWLAEQFVSEGKRTAILTRGYRGEKEANDGQPQSDEVALYRNRLRENVQLGVGRDRLKNGEILARGGTDFFILDDGFQHVQLSRDVDVVLLDATDPFGGGRVLPAGRLREPVSALRRADIVVITRAEDSPVPAIEAMIQRHSECPIFYTRTKFDCLLTVPELAAVAPENGRAGNGYFAFCGIGNPRVFFADLNRWGFHVLANRAFADHHAYSQEELAEMQRGAVDHGAFGLLCTEKDVWNLRHLDLRGMPIYCCRISLEFRTPGFREAIEALLNRGGAEVAR